MATDAPTILAISAGLRDNDRLRFQFADLLHYAVDLSGAAGVVPRVCSVGRPLVHRLVADGTLGTTHCTDDGVGILYRGAELVGAVSEQPGKAAYIVRRDGGLAVEERPETRLLGQRPAQR